MNDSTLPGCFGDYGKPLRPNKCEVCNFVVDCKRVVAKDRLKFILDGIEEARQILKGEKAK